MKRKPHSRRKRTTTKSVLRLPDLEHAKAAVLNSLTSLDAQRGYRHAIDEFVEWYCSEPRLSFNRTVVLRYRIHLESRKLAPGTVNLRLGAVRRLAPGSIWLKVRRPAFHLAGFEHCLNLQPLPGCRSQRAASARRSCRIAGDARRDPARRVQAGETVMCLTSAMCRAAAAEASPE